MYYMRFIVTFLLLLQSLFCLNAQVVSGFTANITNTESVLLSWTIKSGKTCSDLALEFANDDYTFQEIYFIAGVCGNDSADSYYSFDHSSISNQGLRQYRIRFNHDEFSDTISIDSPLNRNKLVNIFPQPATQIITIQGAEINDLINEIRIFSTAGQLLHTQSFQKAHIQQLDISFLASGRYLLWVSLPNKWTKSNLTVIH